MLTFTAVSMAWLVVCWSGFLANPGDSIVGTTRLGIGLRRGVGNGGFGIPVIFPGVFFGMVFLSVLGGSNSRRGFAVARSYRALLPVLDGSVYDRT